MLVSLRIIVSVLLFVTVFGKDGPTGPQSTAPAKAEGSKDTSPNESNKVTDTKAEGAKDAVPNEITKVTDTKEDETRSSYRDTVILRLLQYSSIDVTNIPGLNWLNSTKIGNTNTRKAVDTLVRKAQKYKHLTEEQQKKNAFCRKKAGLVEVPEDFSDYTNPDLMKIFSRLLKERRRIQREMFFHILSTGSLDFLNVALAAYPLLQHLIVYAGDQNDKWGGSIEERWMDQQENMANFILRLIIKRQLNPEDWKDKKIKIEYAHKKFATVPVYRTHEGEDLPESAQEIVQNKLHMVKNYFV